MLKLKIRKVDASKEELFNRIEKLLMVDESIPSEVYIGTYLKKICVSLGIKEIDFWEFRFDNKSEFDEKFVVRVSRNNSAWKDLLRKSTAEKLGFVDEED